MNPKSENNKYDIVLEAEAVLLAYSERCKVYEKKSAKRQRASLKKRLFILFCLASVIWLICWFVNLL